MAQVPVFYHSCNFTGPYTDEALKTVAKFPFVVISQPAGHWPQHLWFDQNTHWPRAHIADDREGPGRDAG